MLGAQRLTLRAEARDGAALLISERAAATLAKLTAAVVAGLFALVFLLLERRRLGRRFYQRVSVLAAVEAVPALPYCWYFLVHGSPAPLTPAFHATHRAVGEVKTHLNGWQPDQSLQPSRQPATNNPATA